MFVSLETAKNRYETCKQCDFFNSTTRQCKDCLCFMPGKVTLSFAKCPKGKWLEDYSNKDIKPGYTSKDFS